MLMPPLNILLAQVLFLSIVAGPVVGLLIYRSFSAIGFHGVVAGIFSTVATFSAVALSVYLRCKYSKRPVPRIKSKLAGRYRVGSAFVTIGNTAALIGCASLLLPGEAVIGGIAVLVGGWIAFLAWVIGWAVTRSTWERPEQGTDKNAATS